MLLHVLALNSSIKIDTKEKQIVVNSWQVYNYPHVPNFNPTIKFRGYSINSFVMASLFLSL